MPCQGDEPVEDQADLNDPLEEALLVEGTLPIEQGLRDTFAALFRRQGEAVAAALRKTGLPESYEPDRPVQKAVVPEDVESWLANLLRRAGLSEEDLAEAIRPYIERALAVGAQSAHRRTAPTVQVSWELRSPEAEEFLRAHPIRFARQVGETTNRQIRETLAQGLARGETMEELADRVRRVFEEAGGVRAEIIARTEANRAVSEGQLLYWGQGGVEKVRYVTGLDERVCPICAPLHGQVFERGQASGVIPKHPRCRCYWAPVVEEEAPRRRRPGAQPPAKPDFFNTKGERWTVTQKRWHAREFIKEAEADFQATVGLEPRDVFPRIELQGDVLRIGSTEFPLRLPADFRRRYAGRLANARGTMEVVDVLQDLLAAAHRRKIVSGNLRWRVLYRVQEAFRGRSDQEFRWALQQVLSQKAIGARENLHMIGTARPPQVEQAQEWLRRYIPEHLEPTSQVILDVRRGPLRASYRKQDRVIRLSEDDEWYTVVHEFGHHIHSAPRYPGVSDLVEGFFRNRVTKEPLSVMYETGSGLERARFDRFYQPYVGRVYDWESDWGRGEEVLSMGLELFAHSPAALYALDREHFLLIWGLLRGIGL